MYRTHRPCQTMSAQEVEDTEGGKVGEVVCEHGEKFQRRHQISVGSSPSAPELIDYHSLYHSVRPIS